jgi:hypothetical protein
MPFLPHETRCHAYENLAGLLNAGNWVLFGSGLDCSISSLKGQVRNNLINGLCQQYSGHVTTLDQLELVQVPADQ